MSNACYICETEIPESERNDAFIISANELYHICPGCYNKTVLTMNHLMDCIKEEKKEE